MITIKEYAKRHGISYEAARKCVRRYEGAPELKGHIVHDGRTLLLDDEAEEFLDGKRKQIPIIVAAENHTEELESLRRENAELLRKIAAIQELLIAEKDRVSRLQDEKMALLEQKVEEQKEEAAADRISPEPKRHWWQRWRKKGDIPEIS